MKNIESISRTELSTLANQRGPQCVSVYLEAPVAGEETLRTPVRLKLLLRQARERFEQLGVDKRRIESRLEPLDALVEDRDVWQHQSGGLGLFSTDDFFVSHPLSYAPEDRVFVGERFHLKPLLPMWADDGEFLLLTLSKNSVKLHRAGRHALRPIPIDDVPQSLAEALRFDDPEKSLQIHSGQPAGTGQQTGIIHGHGAAKEDSKERTLRFFQHLDRGLKPHLNKEGTPLLLAGVDYYLPLYREANSYPHLVDDIVAGNPENVPEADLLKAAWQKMEPRFRRTREEAFAAITAGISNGRATVDLDEAVAASCQGRADKCFVSLQTHHWGRYDEETAKVQTLEASDERAIDLLDLAAAETLLKGGDVFPVGKADDMPGDAAVAVLHRF